MATLSSIAVHPRCLSAIKVGVFSALGLLLSGCAYVGGAVLAPFYIAAISICLLGKETPPTPVATEKNVSVSVGNSVFRVEKLAISVMRDSGLCIVAVEVSTQGVPERLGVRPYQGSIPKGQEALWKKIDGLYFNAAQKFARSEEFGCKIGRIVVRGKKYFDYARLHGNIDMLVNEDGSLRNLPRSDC